MTPVAVSHLVHELVLGQHLAHGAAPRHHVEDPGRQPRLRADLGEQQRGQPRVGRGLQDHRVARGEGRGDLASGQ